MDGHICGYNNIIINIFILLYSFSTTDNERLQLIAAALKGEITGIPMKLENTPDISLEDIEQGIGKKVLIVFW